MICIQRKYLCLYGVSKDQQLEEPNTYDIYTYVARFFLSMKSAFFPEKADMVAICMYSHVIRTYMQKKPAAHRGSYMIDHRVMIHVIQSASLRELRV